MSQPTNEEIAAALRSFLGIDGSKPAKRAVRTRGQRKRKGQTKAIGKGFSAPMEYHNWLRNEAEKRDIAGGASGMMRYLIDQERYGK